MTDSVADFFHMGGYAFYVWWSYAIVAAVLALNLIAPALRHRRVYRTLARNLHPADPDRDEP